MEYKEIIFETDSNHVCTITINRPDRMNTFTPTMIEEFSDAWRHIRTTDEIHSVVLRAADCRAFCTGVDVKIGLDEHPNVWSRRDPGEDLSPKANKVWKPVVCAVHGLAAGGAFPA